MQEDLVSYYRPYIFVLLGPIAFTKQLYKRLCATKDKRHRFLRGLWSSILQAIARTANFHSLYDAQLVKHVACATNFCCILWRLQYFRTKTRLAGIVRKTECTRLDTFLIVWVVSKLSSFFRKIQLVTVTQEGKLGTNSQLCRLARTRWKLFSQASKTLVASTSLRATQRNFLAAIRHCLGRKQDRTQFTRWLQHGENFVQNLNS